jgi:hypothetical protein
MLASTAKASPPTIPSFMQRATTVSNRLTSGVRQHLRSSDEAPWLLWAFGMHALAMRLHGIRINHHPQQESS